MKKFRIIFAALAAIFFTATAFAQIVVPEINVWEQISQLALNWGSMTTLAKGTLFVLIATQLVKQATDFEYKRVLVALLSIAYGVFQKLTGDMSLSAAVMSVLISMGGAMMLYEALKPFLREIPFFSFLKLSKND